MPTFEFSAIDRSGRTLTGALASTDGDAARRTLERRGLVATQITAGTGATTTRNARPLNLGTVGNRFNAPYFAMVESATHLGYSSTLDHGAVLRWA